MERGEWKVEREERGERGTERVESLSCCVSHWFLGCRKGDKCTHFYSAPAKAILYYKAYWVSVPWMSFLSLRDVPTLLGKSDWKLNKTVFAVLCKLCSMPSWAHLSTVLLSLLWRCWPGADAARVTIAICRDQTPRPMKSLWLPPAILQSFALKRWLCFERTPLKQCELGQHYSSSSSHSLFSPLLFRTCIVA